MLLSTLSSGCGYLQNRFIAPQATHVTCPLKLPLRTKIGERDPGTSVLKETGVLINVGKRLIKIV